MTVSTLLPSDPLQIENTRFIHRLLLLRYDIASDFVLNSGLEPTSARGTATAPAAELYRLINAMKAEAYDTQRGRVDYPHLCASPTYAEYCQCARRLRSFDPAALASREERLAFWINLYNALIVDAVIQFEVKESVGDIPGFFWRAAYGIGGRRYCAFDIEYGILRANATHPAIPGAHFGSRDSRRRYNLDCLDPRLHFALVCAARSCPPINMYNAERIDSQLDLVTRAFVNGGSVLINRAHSEVRLSQIFRWYAPDFGGRPFGLGNKRPLLEFVARYLNDEADQAYVLHSNPNVRFQAYDWTLNS